MTIHKDPTGAKPSVSFLRRLGRYHIGTYLILLLVSLAFLGPLFMLVNTSLNTLPQFMRNPTTLVSSLEFQNFADAWEKANFPQYLLNSGIYTVVGTTIFVLSAIFVAFPLARGYVRGANFLLILFVIALFLPPALIPQFQLILNIGLYNTRIGYILLFLVNPIAMIIMVNYIKTIPRELDEAAAIDGASYFRFVIQVVLPLAKPAIATVVVIHAIGIWNELIMATIYLPNQKLYPVTRGLLNFQGVYGSNWPLLAAAVMLLTIPMVILYIFLQRYIISGLTAGSVKG